MTAAKLRDHAAAYARIAKAEAQAEAAFAKRDADFKCIRKDGIRVARDAIRRAGWKIGETLLAKKDRGWAMGIYVGCVLDWPPSKPGNDWHLTIKCRSLLKNGRPGKAITGYSVIVDDPAKLADGIKIVGKVTLK